MELHDLKPAVGSTKQKRRIGRGPGSGKGGTSTRGHKGAKSRSGYKQKVGFEGGQMPLQRRVPKGGFKNPFRVEYKAVNVGLLDSLAEKNNWDKITVAALVEAGLIRKKQLVKVLAQGEIKRKLVVEAHAFSKKAEEMITAAGGSIVKL